MEDLAVGLRDVEFQRRFLWGRMQGEAHPHYCWVAIGMPYFRERFERSVVCLFHHPNHPAASATEPQGTGFLVSRRAKRGLLNHVYAVSNRHVVEECPRIRINTKAGSSRFIDVEFDEWLPSGTDDLAATDITDKLGFDYDALSWSDDFAWIEEGYFVAKPERGFRGPHIGDDVFMVGLYVDHQAGSQNAPVGRFGNVASIPSLSHPVSLSPSDPYKAPGYLIDMRSRTGFSGSPVWMWRAGTDLSDIPWEDSVKEGTVYTRPTVALLGIHRGQIWEEIGVKERNNPRHRWSTISVPSSMTGVVPSWQITALLDHAAFEGQRVQRDSRPDRQRLTDSLKDQRRCQEITAYHRAATLLS